MTSFLCPFSLLLLDNFWEYQYFHNLNAKCKTLFCLIFQTFHGVWTIAFFCLTVIETGAILPNASCLLAGYLPATTVLHILLIPNDYPLEYIITDAVGTFLAIITMFLLLRMECTGIKSHALTILLLKVTLCLGFYYSL